MIQCREIITCIDSAKGTLVTPDGAKINRDEHLPRLILADEVIFIASFVSIKEENNIISVEPEAIDSSLNYRIIGDCDMNNETAIMFSGTYLPEKSEPDKGRIAFHIKTFSTRFYEALNNTKSKKGDFVILAQSSDPIRTIVLAKDSFIAENRPCDNVAFEDIQLDEIITKDELQLLLDLKSPMKHTHSVSDITDLTVSGQIAYTAGNGIDITGNTVSVDTNIIATREFVLSQNPENPPNGSNYTAGNGISISDDNEISIKGVRHFDEPQDGFIGLYTDENGLHFAGDMLITKQELSEQLGGIDSILDNINGEVI